MYRMKKEWSAEESLVYEQERLEGKNERKVRVGRYSTTVESTEHGLANYRAPNSVTIESF